MMSANTHNQIALMNGLATEIRAAAAAKPGSVAVVHNPECGSALVRRWLQSSGTNARVVVLEPDVAAELLRRAGALSSEIVESAPRAGHMHIAMLGGGRASFMQLSRDA